MFGRYVAARFSASIGAGAIESLSPLVAAVALDASASEIGLITATTLAIGAIFRIPAGMWADRRPRPVVPMAVLTLLEGATTALVPVLWLLGSLSMPSFLLVVAASVLVQTFVASLGHLIVNDLVPGRERVGAVGKLNSARNAANIAGHSGSAGLISLLPAPLTFLVNTVFACVSASFLRGLNRATTPAANDTDPASAEESHPGTESTSAAPSAAGSVRALFAKNTRQPDLWLVWTAAVIGSLSEPIAVLFFLRELGIPAAAVGVLTATGAVGGILGGIVTAKLTARIRYRHTVWSAVAIMLLAVSFVPLLPHDSVVSYVGVVVFECGTAFGGTILIASVFGALQVRTRRAVISRTMSVAGVIMEATSLAGIGAGVLLAQAVTYRQTFVVVGVAYGLLTLTGIALARRGALPEPIPAADAEHAST